MLGDLARLRHVRATLTQLRAESDGSSSLGLELAHRMAAALLARATAMPTIDRCFVEGLSTTLGTWMAPLEFADARDEVMRLANEALAPEQDCNLGPLLQALGEFQTKLVQTPDTAVRPLLSAILDLESQRFVAMRAAALASEAGDQDPAKKGPTEPTPGMDLSKLTAFLREAHSGEKAVTVVDCQTLSGGHSKTTMLLTLDQCTKLPDHVVLRKDSNAVHSAGSVSNEFALLLALEKQGVRVPRPLACEPTGAVLGAPFIAMTKSGGTIVGDLLRLSPRDPPLCRNIARELALIHSLPVSHLSGALSGEQSTSASAWVGRILDQDYESWSAMGIADPIYETAYAWLRANVGINDSVPLALVHGDFGLQNILVEDSDVKAVLDWEFASLGCAAYDLGYFYDQAEALGSWDAFCDAYRAEGGRSYEPDLLAYHVLMTAARFGVMGHRLLQQLDSIPSLDDNSAAIICAFFIEIFAGRVARALQQVLTTRSTEQT